jgi:hypothetical protein
MRWHVFRKSPELPLGFRWSIQKPAGEYESEVDALIRAMLEREDIRKDQQIAWDRWWLNPAGLAGHAPEEVESEDTAGSTDEDAG